MHFWALFGTTGEIQKPTVRFAPAHHSSSGGKDCLLIMCSMGRRERYFFSQRSARGGIHQPLDYAAFAAALSEEEPRSGKTNNGK